jgi:hypothetical protein
MIEDKLAQVGLSLPTAAKPAFAYVPVALRDGVAYLSGQLPKIDGEVRVFGKVGREVTLDAARRPRNSMASSFAGKFPLHPISTRGLMTPLRSSLQKQIVVRAR